MIDSPFPPALYVDHDRSFRRVTAQLAGEPLLAIDTESNSLYAYRERICLIQVSTRSTDYIIDPLRVADLRPLGDLLADPKIEKVFHAAEYDLICLKRDYGFVVNNLFDTMIAARICGRKAIGLDKLLAEYCGVAADKSHQRDDWGQRPLSDESLLYAQMDTHYLPELRDKLHAELVKQDRQEEARETFAEASQVEAAVRSRFDPDGFWRIGIPNDLTRRQMAILRELYLLRENLAEERDLPPFKIFTDKLLVILAESAPATLDALSAIRGMTPLPVRRYGKLLLRAIDLGRRAPLPLAPPRHPIVDPVAAERFTILRDWRRQRAEQRGVESDVIVSRDTLWELAYKAPTESEGLEGITGLGPWRKRTYGEEILAVIRRFNHNHHNSKR
jgi:ribonuclease D